MRRAESLRRKPTIEFENREIFVILYGRKKQTSFSSPSAHTSKTKNVRRIHDNTKNEVPNTRAQRSLQKKNTFANEMET